MPGQARVKPGSRSVGRLTQYRAHLRRENRRRGGLQHEAKLSLPKAEPCTLWAIEQLCHNGSGVDIPYFSLILFRTFSPNEFLPVPATPAIYELQRTKPNQKSPMSSVRARRETLDTARIYRVDARGAEVVLRRGCFIRCGRMYRGLLQEDSHFTRLWNILWFLP
jgi:hypothetical protein